MTISFNRLGNDGRLGNQMFQYAFLRGVAKNRGFDWMIPGDDEYSRHNYGLFDCFEMTGVKPENIGRTTNRTVECFDTTFQENIFNNCTTNTDFLGTFQTEKYFENATDEIRKDFTFKKGYLEPCQEFVDSLGGRDNCIFLHVRRGNPNLDENGFKWSYQLLQDTHPLCKPQYYINALKEFSEDKNVIVVSDLIDWCKKQDLLQGDRFHFSDSSYETFADGASVPYVDLCLMSLCGGAIIANSSLSWWGAWLQNDVGRVITPDPWYGPKVAHLDTKDLIPQRWYKHHNDPTPIPPEV